MPFIEVTSVKLNIPENPTRNLYAYASICLAQSFVVKDIEVYRNARGLAVQMPERTKRRKCVQCSRPIMQVHAFCFVCGAEQPRIPRDQIDWLDIANPVTAEQREEITAAILSAYAERVYGRNVVPVEEGGSAC